MPNNLYNYFNSVRVIHRCMASQVSQTVTGLTMLQNRYSPVMYLILVTIAFFGYGESVSPHPRCQHGIMFTRFPVVVRYHSPYVLHLHS